MKLGVILGTVREGRISVKLANWVVKSAQQHDGVEVELIDLADYPMPFFAEPASPRYNPNRSPDPTAKKWMDKVAEFDAYIFVSPEYNHSIPGVLKNAFDYLDFQTNRKPATMATHGTVGGARAAMHLKEIISESRAVPIQNHIAITDGKVSKLFDDNGNVLDEAAVAHTKTVFDAMLEELKWYSDALAAARAQG